MTDATENEETEETKDLTAADIFSANDLKLEPVEVPEWGGRVYVRRLTGRERDEFEQLMTDRKAGRGVLKCQGIISKVVTLATCNAEGAQMFTEADASKLDDKACAPLMRVFDAAMKVSGMRQDDIQNITEGLELSPS